MKFVDPRPLPAGIEVVPLTIWREARGEGLAGMLAVAWVIRNRARHNHWWSSNPEEVCLQAFQFSCWNETDRQRHLCPSSPNQECYRTATNAWRSIWPDVQPGPGLEDPTGGATYYVEKHLTPNPRDGDRFVKVAEIGNHLFYRDA